MNEEKPIQTEAAPFTMDKKKWLYSFIVKDDAGVSYRFFIKNPSRTQKQNGEIEYAKQLAKFVKAGLLPKAAWSTILENLGGTVSDADAEQYSAAKRLFFEVGIRLNELNQLAELSEEQKDEKIDLEIQIDEAKKRIQSFELEQIYIFENTAEAKARNATINWWMTELAYKDESTPFFVGQSLDEKLDWYEDLDENDAAQKISLKAGQRFSYFISLWFLNRISSFEDFESADGDSTRA